MGSHVEPAAPPKPTFTHRWRLRRVLGERFGKLCRIVPKTHKVGQVARFGWNEVLTVEFQDGTQVEASRMAIMPAGRAHLAANCKETDCPNPVRGLGLCQKHWWRDYSRKRKIGV